MLTPFPRSSITFTSEGNPSLRPSPHDPSHKLINLDKYHKLSKIAIEFAQRYQQSFNLAVLPDVQNWLMVVLAERGGESLDGLHRKSCESEWPMRCQYRGIGGERRS